MSRRSILDYLCFLWVTLWYVDAIVRLSFAICDVICNEQGGASVLTFATTSGPPPAKSTVDFLSGIIAGSPLIQQTKPASKLLRWVGGKVSLVAPYQLIPAAVNPDVSLSAFISQFICVLQKHCRTSLMILPLMKRTNKTLS